MNAEQIPQTVLEPKAGLFVSAYWDRSDIGSGVRQVIVIRTGPKFVTCFYIPSLHTFRLLRSQWETLRPEEYNPSVEWITDLLSVVLQQRTDLPNTQRASIELALTLTRRYNGKRNVRQPATDTSHIIPSHNPRALAGKRGLSTISSSNPVVRPSRRRAPLTHKRATRSKLP